MLNCSNPVKVLIWTLKEKELNSYLLYHWRYGLKAAPHSAILIFILQINIILHEYSNHTTSEFPGQGVDSSSKGNLNKKIIFTGATRSQNSCTITKTCWNEFIAICLYFANQLNQTPQIYSNMRKIFKLFVFCPFSTRNSQCQCFCQFECSSITVNSFVHSLWEYTYATSNPRYQHHAKKPTVKVRTLPF